MKIEKLSLASIKNVLSRAELRKIMAGSGGGEPPSGPGGGGGGGGGGGSPGYGQGCFNTPNTSYCPPGLTCIPQGGSSQNGTCQ